MNSLNAQSATVNAEARRSNNQRRGYTLIELVASIGAASILMAGMGSAVFLSAQAFTTSESPTGRKVDTAQAQQQVLRDLRYANSFSERTANAVTFTVPDRTGDGRPDTIRYVWSGTPGDPLTYALNGASPVTVAASVNQFELSFQTQMLNAPVIPDDNSSAATILFVSGGKTANLNELFKTTTYVELTDAENSRLSNLEGAGFTFQRILDEASDQDVAQALKEVDAVYISGEADESKLSSLYFSTSLGVVNEHYEAAHSFGFCGKAEVGESTTIELLDSTHYILTDFDSGPMTVATSPIPMFYASPDYSADLQTLTLFADGDARPAMLALNAGAEGVDGTSVPGRRVQLPFGSASFDSHSVTGDAWRLVRTSINWALGNGDDGIPNVVEEADQQNFGYETKFANADWGYRRMQVATQVELSSGGTLQSISAYLSFVAADARAAIYSDASGEPGTLIAQSGSDQSDANGSWITFSLTDTDLTPGTYWLAVGLTDFDQEIFYARVPGGRTRVRKQDAVKNGFTSDWGESSIRYNKQGISIYGTIEVAE